MIKFSNNTYFRLCASVLTILFICGAVAFAQDKTERKVKGNGFCSNDRYFSSNDKAFHQQIYEKTLRAENVLAVDGGRNGGIKVKGEDRTDVLVRACVQTQAATAEAARAMTNNIRIETSPNVRAENTIDESNWAVSYEILVPRSINLKLSTKNGGVSIASVEGMLEFETHNGGIELKDVAGDVVGKTRNGGVSVTLSGDSWKGNGLNVETTNGGVQLSISENYAAHIETSTVNGGLQSEISQLNVDRNEKNQGVRLNTNLNGGGAPIRIVTRNGGIKINSSARRL